MTIKINKKNYQIKPASEMTVSEYIAFFDNLSDNPSQFDVIMNYLSIITGLTYKDVESINIDDNSLRRLMVYIGKIDTPNEIKQIDNFYYKRTGKRLYQKNLSWRTMGARKLIEERKSDNQLELAVYLLAIYVCGEYDAEKIEIIYNELQTYNAISVFGFIIFFFKALSNGQKREKNYLIRRIQKVFQSIAKLSSK